MLHVVMRSDNKIDFQRLGSICIVTIMAEFPFPSPAVVALLQ